MKKILSVILAFILLITACPLVVFADGHTVRTEALVLGTESASNEQEGWSYDASTHTLVLSNVTIDCSDAEQNGNCITATEDLNIVLEGENNLYSRTACSISEAPTYVIKYSGDLSVSGTGILNVVEGNYPFFCTSSECSFVIESGDIIISHDFTNPEIDQSSDAVVIANNNIGTVINGGRIYSDVIFFAKEINGGNIESYSIASKADLTINGGKIDTGSLAAMNMKINDGTVNVTGGFTSNLLMDYINEIKLYGILAMSSFEMNGGTVNTFGAIAGIFAFNSCVFNGGTFTAESDGTALCVLSEESVEPTLSLSNNVDITTPSSYNINTFAVKNAISEFSDNGYVEYRNGKAVSVWDADVEAPAFDYDQSLMKVESNAAKKVVIEEVEATVETVKLTFVDATSETMLDPITIDKGAKYTFPKTSPIDPPSDKEFSGKYSCRNEADTETFFVEAGQEYTIDCDLMIQPIWQKATPADITITYDANGGTIGKYWIDSEVVKGEDLPKEISVPKNAPESVVTPPKYKVFDGFEVNGVRYEAGEIFSFSEDSTCKFLWKYAKDEWIEEEEKIYYYQEGEPLKGLQEIDGKNYIFSKTTGELLYGKVRCDGKYYVMSKATGEMLYGMVRCDGKYYVMSKATGEMLYGMVRCDGKYYVMSKTTGEMLYGKVSCDGKTYICSKADGHIFKNQNVSCDGVKYYCDKNGVATKR